MEARRHHDRMDPIAFLIANDISRRFAGSAEPAPPRRRRPAARARRIRT
jgi:hypothetical protein